MKRARAMSLLAAAAAVASMISAPPVGADPLLDTGNLLDAVQAQSTLSVTPTMYVSRPLSSTSHLHSRLYLRTSSSLVGGDDVSQIWRTKNAILNSPVNVKSAIDISKLPAAGRSLPKS